MPAQGGKLGWGQVAVGAGGLGRDLRRIVAAEERGVDDYAVHYALAAEPDDRPVVPGLTAAPGLPAVVNLALVAELRRRERRRVGLDQVLLLGEELVVGGDHAAAERPGREVGHGGEAGFGHVGDSLVRSRPACWPAPACTPRSHVLRTVPRNSWPRYGVSRCLVSSWPAVTTNRSSGANATRSASRPCSMAPLPPSPASLAGLAAIQPTTSASENPRFAASVHTAGKPS